MPGSPGTFASAKSCFSPPSWGELSCSASVPRPLAERGRFPAGITGQCHGQENTGGTLALYNRSQSHSQPSGKADPVWREDLEQILGGLCSFAPAGDSEGPGEAQLNAGITATAVKSQ